MNLLREFLARKGKKRTPSSTGTFIESSSKDVSLGVVAVVLWKNTAPGEEGWGIDIDTINRQRPNHYKYKISEFEVKVGSASEKKLNDFFGDSFPAESNGIADVELDLAIKGNVYHQPGSNMTQEEGGIEDMEITGVDWDRASNATDKLLHSKSQNELISLLYAILDSPDLDPNDVGQFWEIVEDGLWRTQSEWS